MNFSQCMLTLLSYPNPDRKVLLRWSNVTSDESGDIQPDATISQDTPA